MRTRLSRNGHLVVPKEIRERLAWRGGSWLDIEEVADGILLRLARAPGEATVDDLIGSTGYRGRRRSLEEMEAGPNHETPVIACDLNAVRLLVGSR